MSNSDDFSDEKSIEYKEAEAEGVEDDAIEEDAGRAKFQITSYGVDYTVDTILKRMNNGNFIIPKFQRKYVWPHRHASRFVESLLMGLPVPGIFLYKKTDTNESLVIDGQQRLQTLYAFCSKGFFGEKKFRLRGVHEPWEGKTYEELDPSDQLKIDDSIIHATIFQQDKPSDSLESIVFVFERINTGGIRLSSQEIRSCVADGPFLNLVKELNCDHVWRSIYGPMSPRGKDEELIIRFFALLVADDIYQRPMSKFLTDFTQSANKFSSNKLEEMRDIFLNTIRFIVDNLNVRPFRPYTNLNTAVFDAVMVGVAKNMSSGTVTDPRFFEQKYHLLLSNTKFLSASSRATADEESVKIRLSKAIEAFKKDLL